MHRHLGEVFPIGAIARRNVDLDDRLVLRLSDVGILKALCEAKLDGARDAALRLAQLEEERAIFDCKATVENDAIAQARRSRPARDRLAIHRINWIDENKALGIAEDVYRAQRIAR